MSDYQSQSDDYQYKVDYIRFGKGKDECFGSMSWSFDQIIETTTDDEDNARRIARRLADEEKFARQGKDGIGGFIVLKEDYYSGSITETDYIAFAGSRQKARRILRKHHRGYLKRGRYFSPFLKKPSHREPCQIQIPLPTGPVAPVVWDEDMPF